ncbi:alpha-N-acetylglucosaminidase [Arcticibacter sp.]|uniref:alpha-N-acetylglucosaminidase n=1 Tax=Arcticibacter sp. TaxID=1872630 RepID=UPI00388EBE9A
MKLMIMKSLIIAAVCSVFTIHSAVGKTLREPQAPDLKPAADLIKRVLPKYADRFKIVYIPKEDNKDVFELETEGSKVVLKGNNGVSIASAFNYWLKNYAHCDISWNGSNLNIPKPFPLVSEKVRKVTPYKYRHYLNYCTFNYTASWWDWERWQWEIDFMAMNGINMPLALTGQNSIWDKVYRSMGFGDQDMDAFFSGPAYFNWFWMGNLDAWGGPLSKDFMKFHEDLQKQILARERELGMTPVLPSFTGHVPPSFKEKFPEVKLNTTQWGINVAPVYVLDPETPLFTEIGKKFLEELTRTFGTDHLYSADTFNEMIPPSNDSLYLNGMAKKIFNSMTAVDTQATWVMQGWMFLDKPNFWQPTQMKALFSAVPEDKLIVLDLNSEVYPVWSRTEAFYGENWIWNMLHNFGGRVSMYGDMEKIAKDPADALNDPKSGKMVGIGLTMEAIEQNPAIYALMFENVWRKERIPLGDWLKDYAHRRYGSRNPEAEKGWEILEKTVYGHQPWWGTSSIITGRPTFEKETTWTYTHIPYNSLELFGALEHFIAASGNLRKSEGFQYDLVDITRQVLANYSNVLQQDFAKDYHNKDIRAYLEKRNRFLQLIDDMDKLLATRKDFLLGRWLNEARRRGSNDREKDLFEKNARDLITLWLDKDCNIHEYAAKEWSGMLRGFYKPRWEKFFAYVDECDASGKAPDMKQFEENIKHWEWSWVNANEPYTEKPTGDPVNVALAMFKKYAPLIKSAYPNSTLSKNNK